MHSRLCRALVISLFAVGAGGCAGFFTAPVQPPIGLLYSRYNAVIDIDSDETELGSKVGRSEASSILGLIATGDASVASAAKAGGITTIRHIDYEFFTVLGIYGRFTTVVYGD